MAVQHPLLRQHQRCPPLARGAGQTAWVQMAIGRASKVSDPDSGCSGCCACLPRKHENTLGTLLKLVVDVISPEQPACQREIDQLVRGLRCTTLHVVCKRRHTLSVPFTKITSGEIVVVEMGDPFIPTILVNQLVHASLQEVCLGLGSWWRWHFVSFAGWLSARSPALKPRRMMHRRRVVREERPLAPHRTRPNPSPTVQRQSRHSVLLRRRLAQDEQTVEELSGGGTGGSGCATTYRCALCCWFSRRTGTRQPCTATTALVELPNTCPR